MSENNRYEHQKIDITLQYLKISSFIIPCSIFDIQMFFITDKGRQYVHLSELAEYLAK